MASHTFFVIQAFLDLPRAGGLHAQLRDYVHNAPKLMGYDKKNRYYQGFARAVLPWVPHFKRGVWDYVEDSANAMNEWSGWTNGTLEDATDAAETADPRAAFRGGPQSMFFTLCFLLQKGGVADQIICERCRIPEHQMWTRQAFGTLVATPPQFHFPSVKGDAIFVRPGATIERGVTEIELGEERYKYLRVLST